MTSLKKHKYFFAMGAILIGIIVLIYLYIGFATFNYFTQLPKDKFIDISNIRIVGWENGKKSWQIEAEKASTTKDRNVTEFENIKNGIVYKNDKIVLKNITAPKVLINSVQNRLDASAAQEIPEQFLKALIDLKGAADDKREGLEKTKFSLLQAPHIIYDTANRKTYADKVTIKGDKFSIKSGKSEINHDNSTSIFTFNPILHSGNYMVSAQTIEVFFKDEKLTASGGINFKISGNNLAKTEAKGRILFFSLNTHDAQIFDDIELNQKGKTAFSKNLFYSDSRKTAVLTDGVKIIFSKGEALLKEKLLRKIKSEEARKALKEKTMLSCKTLNLSIINGSATAEGNVVVEQKKRRAKSDFASYNDEDETIAMAGNVFIEKGKEWIKSRSLLVSLRKESFEAIGKVETRFILKR